MVDIVARIIAQPAAQQLGQSIIIDNRPGADITIKAPPDGYTLFFATITAMSAVPPCATATALNR